MSECLYRTGQHVIITEHRYWRGKTPTIHQATVVKVGRKYVTAHIDSRPESETIQFVIAENYAQNTVYAPDYTIYPSIDQYYREVEHNYYLDVVERIFRNSPHATLKSKLSTDWLKPLAIKLGATPWEPPDEKENKE